MSGIAGGAEARWNAPSGHSGSVEVVGVMVEEQERLAFILETTKTGIWTVRPNDDAMELDARAQSVIGAYGAVLPLQDLTKAMDGTAADAFRALLDNPDHSDDEREFRLQRSGEMGERWVAMRSRRAADGSMTGTVRDVTDTKRNDLHVHMLMREVTHRSKNLLAIIQAMARQTVKDSLTAADFEARFSARLRGLSFSHELLASQDWRGASLTELAEGHLRPLRERHGSRIEIMGPVVFVRPEAAQNIGLALNELASNAQRFGALSGAEGTVRLEWHIDADENGPRALHVLWTEAGAATDLQPPSRQGFGHKVMERVVAHALDAIVTMSFAPTGLNWSLRIPLTHIAS